MKNQKIILNVGMLFLFICFPLISCQTDSSEKHPQEKTDVTAADLFIASEANQNLKKEIGKEMRKERNAISKLSKEELTQYNELKKKMLNTDTRTEAIAQLKELTGYDYQTSRNRISTLVKAVFEGTNFTKLELMRARQKNLMSKVTITRAENNEEERQECYKKCDEDAKEHIMNCYKKFNEDISDLPASEFPDGQHYQWYLQIRDACLYEAEVKLLLCQEDCDRTYPNQE